MTPRLYVYYRIEPAQAEAALAGFCAARGSAPIELLRRPELQDGLETWMEVYPEACVALEPALAAALAPWIRGARHVERFIAVA